MNCCRWMWYVEERPFHRRDELCYLLDCGANTNAALLRINSGDRSHCDLVVVVVRSAPQGGQLKKSVNKKVALLLRAGTTGTGLVGNISSQER